MESLAAIVTHSLCGNAPFQPRTLMRLGPFPALLPRGASTSMASCPATSHQTPWRWALGIWLCARRGTPSRLRQASRPRTREVDRHEP